MKQLLVIAIGLLLLSACSKRSVPACPEQPPASETVPALLACVEGDTSTAEVERLLRKWDRVDDEWGAVTAVDLLPAMGDELVVSYHADLANASWNPQGMLVVLSREGDEWHVAFDAAGVEASAPNGKPWDNWAYRLVEFGDATGDGWEDVLVTLAFSNGTHAFFEQYGVLTAHETDQLRIIFVRTPWSGRYKISKRGEKPVIDFAFGNRVAPSASAITRTYAFAGDAFVQVDEEIDPDRATVSTRLADGSNWYGFDTVGVIGSSAAGGPFGLYRVQDGTLTHVPVKAPVRVLEATAAGTLYVGAGCGVLRYRTGEWVELAPIDECGEESATGSGPVVDIALADGETIWVGSPFALARFDGRWETYPVNATRLLVAPDGSVWAAGWNGRAEGECCFTHLEGSGWVTYTYSAELPVSPQLEQSIRSLR